MNLGFSDTQVEVLAASWSSMKWGKVKEEATSASMDLTYGTDVSSSPDLASSVLSNRGV